VTLPPAPALVGYVLQAVVALQALRIAKLRPLHAPFAVLAGSIALADPLRPVLSAVRAGHAHPLTGAALASWHLDRLLFVGWPVGLAAVAWMALSDRRTAGAHALGALGLGLALQVVLYPRSAVPLVLPAVHGLAVVAGLAAAAGWVRRRRWPDEGQRLVLLYVVAETVVWPLVWLGGDARAAWPLSWSAYLAAVGGAAVGQAVWRRAIQAEQERARAKA